MNENTDNPRIQDVDKPFYSVRELRRRMKDGTFKEILDDWKWIFSYSRRYWWAIVFYIFTGILSTSLSLVSSVLAKEMIDIIVGHCNGFVVFSADAPMWGERGRAEGVDRSKYDMIAGNMQMYGRCLSAFMTYDDIASTEVLASLPEVDADRIGCAGCSMGAYRAWMLSALSDRVKVGASVCWMVTSDVQLTLKYGRSENGGFANCIPGLRQYLDYPHIASLACPKPMLFINGSKDKLFPVPGAEKAFREMHAVWDSQGVGERLVTELWDMPHGCPPNAQQRVLEFLKKNL